MTLENFPIKQSKVELKKNQLKDFNHLLASKVPLIPFYQKLFSEKYFTKDFQNIPPLTSLAEVEQIPFTTKADILAANHSDLLAIPQKAIVRCHATSGTSTNTPLVMFYSQKDIANWQALIARVLTAVEVSSEDIVQISFGYGMFTGGLGFHYAAEKLGCLVVPSSAGGAGSTQKQIETMISLGTTVLICTPSYANYLGEYIFQNNIKKIKLKKVICGGERTDYNLKKNIEKNLSVKVYVNYGLTEMYGPGVAFESSFSKKFKKNRTSYLYINEDFFFAEIIDSVTGKTVKDGEEGELVLTSLRKEAMPLIRYRTGDITHFFVEAEYNNSNRLAETSLLMMAEPSRRVDDMKIIRGVNFYPRQIEQVLVSFDEINPIYEIHLTSSQGKEEVTLELESTDLSENLKQQISQKIKEKVNISARINLHPLKTLERSKSKRKIVYDQRTI